MADKGKSFGGQPEAEQIPYLATFEEVKAYLASQKITGPSDPRFGAVLAHASEEVQQGTLSDLKKSSGEVVAGKFWKDLFTERRKAFQGGTSLPGVGDSGTGLGSREQTAQTLAARAAYDTHKVAQGVSQDKTDYTYTPTEEKDVGWRPGDKYTPLGAAGEEDVSTLDSAIDYNRTDTQGVDAQKALLGTYQDLYKTGGLDAIDRARIAQSQAQRGTEYRGKIGAIGANAEEQGRFGGNAQLLSSLKAADTASRGRREDDLETSALGLSRRNQLLQQQGQVAGDIQSGVDAIGKFNTQGERDRAVANQRAINAGNSDEYAAQETRDRQNNSQQNHGVDAAFDYETGKNRHAADQATEAKRFNVTGDQGARGITGDTLQAQAQDTAANMGYSGQLIGTQWHHDDIEAQNKAQVMGAIGEGVGVATSLIPRPKK